MNILYKTSILVILFFIVTYLLGFLVGFDRNAYSRSPLMILNNTLAPVIIIICIELYRYILIKSINKKSVLNVVITIAIIIFEVFITVKLTKFLVLASAFKYLTTTVLPIISTNVVMTILCRYGGLRPVLLYRIVMGTYLYLVPIVPHFSDYLVSILGICFPIVLYIYVLGDVRDEFSNVETKERFSIGNGIVLTFVICLAMLLSGLFPLVIIGVGSGSMHPKIDKGDAVIYKKVSSDKDIKEGDILVFQSGSKIIVHRLVKKETKKNKIYYVTKGDNNNSNDKNNLTIDNVKGVVTLKIKYIALPSIMFHDYIGGRR